MLTLTPAAAEVVSAVAEANGVPDTGGLRIASTPGVEQAAGLEAEFVAGPDDNDQVVAQAGARVFVDPDAAGYLADKVLTGELDEQGQARFAVGRSEEDSGISGQ